jgi:hypothetical protein
MKSDISKYIFKESEDNNVFFVDVEDYSESGEHLHGYEDGDIVRWIWGEQKYMGTLRTYGGTTTGIFVIKDAKII